VVSCFLLALLEKLPFDPDDVQSPRRKVNIFEVVKTSYDIDVPELAREQFLRFLDWIAATHPDNQAIHQRERKDSRPHDVNEEYHTIGIIVVPGFVLVAVVEYQAFPFRPAAHVISRANS